MFELNTKEIFSAINLHKPEKLIGIKLYDEVNSTNDYLKKNHVAGEQLFQVVIAKHQTAGRGQYAKKWISEHNKGLWMSCAFNIEKQSNLAQLSLLVGYMLAKKLVMLGIKDIRLKWPNDLIVKGRKLGGILVESMPHNRDYQRVIVGVGINNKLPKKFNQVFTTDDLEPTALGALMSNPPSINFLAAQCIESICSVVQEVKKNDFSDFVKSWSEFDLYNGQQVSVKTSSGVIEGLAQGISSKGKLLVQNTKGLHHISTGSVRKLNSEKITC